MSETPRPPSSEIPIDAIRVIDGITRAMRRKGYGHKDAIDVARKVNDGLSQPYPDDLIETAVTVDFGAETAEPEPSGPAIKTWSGIDLYLRVRQFPKETA